MSDKTKQMIYAEWCMRQVSMGFPIPYYGWQAYAADTYMIWQKAIEDDRL